MKYVKLLSCMIGAYLLFSSYYCDVATVHAVSVYTSVLLYLLFNENHIIFSLMFEVLLVIILLVLFEEQS